MTKSAGTGAGTIALDVVLSSAFPGGTVVNTATVASTTSDPVPGNNSSTDSSASGAAEAHLTITKSHVGDFTAGSTGVYSFTVSNTGPSDAASPVTVTDTRSSPIAAATKFCHASPVICAR